MRACVAERRLTFLVRQKTQASLRDAPIPITVTPWAKAHVYLHKPLRGLGRFTPRRNSSCTLRCRVSRGGVLGEGAGARQKDGGQKDFHGGQQGTWGSVRPG